jgi:hypothetical protein
MSSGRTDDSRGLADSRFIDGSCEDSLLAGFDDPDSGFIDSRILDGMRDSGMRDSGMRE